MSYWVVISAALAMAALTLLSGFGLGTLLLPAFALFFPVELAVAATAVVHLANNLFKLALVGRRADRATALRFIPPAVLFAALGAWLLGKMAAAPPLAGYTLGNQGHSITAAKLAIAFLMAFFAVMELSPRLRAIQFPRGGVVLGGAVSGFFGGMSGHQGAFRSAFLVRAGLSKEAFIGTSVLSAVAVDLSRLAVYGATFLGRDLSLLAREGRAGLVAAGALAAFAGSFLGARLVKKVTMEAIHRLVGGLLLFLALFLAVGLI